MKNNVRVFWGIDNQIMIRGYESLLFSEFGTRISCQTFPFRTALSYDFKKEAGSRTILVLHVDSLQSDSNFSIYRFLKKNTRVKVLIILQKFDFRKMRFLFHIGVSGVICENIDSADFIGVFNRIVEGKKGISSDVKEQIIEEYCSERVYKKNGQVAPQLKDSDTQLEDFSNDLYCLTKREREILKLICDGKLTREIADELFISLHTIETHRRNILSKMEVKNTAHMVRVAVSEGLI